VLISFSGKHSGTLCDLIWYLLNTEDKEGQTFISLNEVINKKQNLDTLTVLKISMELAHCLHILNRKGLTLEFLDKEELFLWMLDNKVYISFWLFRVIDNYMLSVKLA
jgi:hypothetical protein